MSNLNQELRVGQIVRIKIDKDEYHSLHNAVDGCIAKIVCIGDRISDKVEIKFNIEVKYLSKLRGNSLGHNPPNEFAEDELIPIGDNEAMAWLI